MSVVQATQSAVACYDSPNQLIESKTAFSFFFFFLKNNGSPERSVANLWTL